MQTIFWVSVAALIYPLLLYPVSLALLGAVRERKLKKGEHDATVALIVAACNEERHIGAMMEQVLRLEFPKERLEVAVASDRGSTDRTHDIVRGYEPHGVRLCLPPTPDRIGKNVSLDAAVAATTGSILVFADATAIWRPDAVRELVANFADPQVGCVSAHKAYWLEDGFGPGSYRRYWTLEGWVDRGSSVLGYIPNASGGFHALRREIYESVPGYMIRDLVDPAQAAGKGYHAILDPSVPYTDAPWVGIAEVYRARVRITMRVLSSTGYILGLLARGRRRVAAFQYVSHKLLRWFLWLPAVGLLVSSLCLAPRHPWFEAPAMLQLLLYASVPFGLRAAQAGFGIPGLTGFAFLVLSLVAMAHGFVNWLTGKRRTTWRLRDDAPAPARPLS